MQNRIKSSFIKTKKNTEQNATKKIKYKKLILFIFTLLAIILTVTGIAFKNNEVEALSKYGSRGDEVKQIQTKLKRWGYYNGNVDGIFGSQTQEAVRYFQRKNGLTVDGIAGPATLKAMGIYNSSNSSSLRKFFCLSRLPFSRKPCQSINRVWIRFLRLLRKVSIA